VTRPPALQRALDALAGGTYAKVICGIGSRKARRIRNLSALYSAAGVHTIDMAAHIDVIEAVQAGLAWAEAAAAREGGTLPQPLLMVSLGLDEDPHVGIPLLDRSVCAVCATCHCETERDCAIRPPEVRKQECPDCMACLRVCPFDAISVVAPGLGNRALLAELIRHGAGAVELHVSGTPTAQVEALWRSLEDLLSPDVLVSFSLGSAVSDPDLVAEHVRLVHSLSHPMVVIQAEGHPMSGTPNGHQDHGEASLDLIREIRALSACNGTFVQASGGCDHGTARTARHHGVPVDGVGFGSLARYLVREVLDDEPLDPDSPDVVAALARARALVRSAGGPPEEA